ncbi:MULTISPECIES: ABC transporter permease [Salinibaculum]|uniref:ABC transporter permease n=1 Tax=Salinibaculum TaxID=2732368 RepID=UPI0030CAFF34
MAGTVSKGSFAAKWVLPFGGLTLLIVIWELTGVFEMFPDFILPPPTTIWSRGVETSNVLIRNTLPTLTSVAVGFIGASSLGLLTALGLTMSSRLREAVYPIIIAMNSLPRIAAAPLFIFYMGGEQVAHMAIAIWVAYFPMVVNSVDGLSQQDEDLNMLLESVDATRWQEMKYITFPNALPHIFDGLKLVATASVVGAIIGEFVAANQGLGFITLLALQSFDVPLVFSAVLIMAVVSVTLFFTIFIIQDKLIHWKSTSLIPE